MDNEEKFVCAVCGETFTSDELTEVHNGDLVCPDCLSSHYTKCDDCGEYVPDDEVTRVYNDDYVCDKCLDNYGYCEDCGEYYPYDDIRYVEEYDTHVCDDCFREHYRECYDCGRIVSESDAVYSDNGDAYCQECYDENFYHCCDCGTEVHRDDVRFIDGDPYCEDCYDDHDECGDDDGIYDYHAFNHNNYIPRYDKDEEHDSNTMLYGLELEVAGSTCYASDVVDKLDNNAIAMHDSSVNGFELVFMPITRKYLYNKLVPLLKDALKYMIDNNFEGHNKGGIHIHFSRLQNAVQVANLTQIIYGNTQDKKLWLKITQRRPENMHWCSMDTSVPTAKEIIECNNYSPAGCSNHGTALNYCTRTNTHELRIFNSNLRLERVLKNFECVFALQDYVMANSEPVCDTQGFIKFVDNHSEDYPHLADFMHEKKIFKIANKFYGDTYTSKPTTVDTVTQVTNMIEDMGEVTTDADVEELVAVG